MKRKLSLLAATFFCFIAWPADPKAVERDAAWVDQRIDAWQPTKAERAFDEIGWAKDLREAKRLAEQHERPIFLFTYDGADLACYRC